MTFKDEINAQNELTRRKFLTGLCATTLGLTGIPRLAQATMAFQDNKIPLLPATARNVIYVYMNGGMSQLDTFDPKPKSKNTGSTKAIKTNADDIFLSSNMKLMANHMDKVVLFSGMSSTQGAHDQGNYLAHTSYPPRGTIVHPPMGVWASKMRGRVNPRLPAHVTIAAGNHAITPGFMEPEFTPLPIGDPLDGLRNSKRPEHVDAKRFNRRLQRIKELNKGFAEKYPQRGVNSYTDMYDQAVALMNSKDIMAFDLKQEPDKLRDSYGRDRFGQGCLLARRLIEHGVRYVEVGNGGWDTHSDNFSAMNRKVPSIDRALSTLLADLEGRGLLDSTLVVLATEFGRTPRINGNRGRDHWPKSYTCMMAGGGLRGGQRYGKTDKDGIEIIENRTTVPDFNATIAYALGLPTKHILYSPSGRPFTVAHKGKPITKVFA